MLAPEPALREGCNGRQRSQYPFTNEWEYFWERCSRGFTDSELRLRFKEFVGQRQTAPSRTEINRWADKVNHPRGWRTQSNAEIVVYFALACFALFVLHTFIHG